MKYRKKPIVIEAWPVKDILHLVVHDWYALPQCIRDTQETEKSETVMVFTSEGIHVRTLEGVMLAEPGDWLLRGVKGEFYPCKPDIFEATYDEVLDEWGDT